MQRQLAATLTALLLTLAPAVAATLVDLATPLGTMRLELADDAKPVTVANFLSYVTSGKYDGTFAHRLEPGFVLQGGTYLVDAAGLNEVPTAAPIINEAGPYPEFSNVYGTIAMAQRGTDPNSATSGWFINLADNSYPLDTLNGGFTVFGRVVDGFDVLAAFAAFPYKTLPTQTNVVVDVSGGNPNNPFQQVPVTRVVNNSISAEDFIYTTWTVVPEPGVAALLALGLAGVLAARQRLRSRA